MIAEFEAPEAIDSEQLRQVVLEVLGTAAKVAALTPTPVDDQIIEGAIGVVNRPIVWRIISRWIGGTLSNTETGAALAEAAPGMDIAAILALIQSLMPMIQSFSAWFRNRRNPAPTPAPAPVV